jgi:exocyst complex component 7
MGVGMSMGMGAGVDMGVSVGGSGYQAELRQRARGHAQLSEVMEDQVARLRSTLQESQQLTGEMDHIMAGFERQLGRLERRIDPIHRRTTVLRRTHMHIDQALLMAEKYLDQYTTAHRVEAPLLGGMHGDYESYLNTIGALDACIHFFSVNRGFRSADVRLSRLRELENAATQECEREFVHTLASVSRPLDLFSVPQRTPKRLRRSPVLLWLCSGVVQ